VATFKRTQGGWQAQIARKGIRKAKTFPTKAGAKDWAARQEYLILNGEGEYGPGSVGDVFNRYAREVSPKKRGARWEQIRLEKISQDKLARIAIRDVRPGDFAEWRDRRLNEVSPSSVNREMTLLSAVMGVASREWGLLPANPLIGVKKPSKPPPRDRLVTDDEVAKLVKAAPDLTQTTGRAIHAFRFAIETGMRAGEIVGMRPEHISGKVAHLPITKNGSSRNVPLSKAALALIDELPACDPVFGLKSAQLDALFRRVRDRVGIEGLTFHDSRHRAATDLSKKLDPFALARVLGHKSMNQTLQYYAATAEDLAARLD